MEVQYQAYQRYDPPFSSPGNMEVYTGIPGTRQFYRSLQVSRIKENWDVLSPFWHDGDLFPSDSFSVIWRGTLLAPVTDQYTFYLRHDSKVRLQLGEQVLIAGSEAPRNQVIEDSVTVWLDRGDSLYLEVDYTHYEHVARVELDWKYSIVDREVVPFSAPSIPDLSGKASGAVLIFPNPVEDDKIYLCVDPAANVGDDFRVEIFDLRGRRYLRKPFRNHEPESISYLPDGFDRYEVSAADLGPGVYILRVRSGDAEYFQRFVKY